MILDDYAAELFSKNINMMVPYYLMASYAYYVEDDPIFSDAFYDNLAKTILAVLDDLEHQHKHLLNTDMLEAGSFVGEYPTIVSNALGSLRKHHANVKKTNKNSSML